MMHGHGPRFLVFQDCNHPLCLFYYTDNAETIIQNITEDNANDYDSSGYSSLTHAASFGYIEIAKKLFECGASATAPHFTHVRHSPLCMAVRHTSVPFIKLLLEHGANPNETFHGSAMLDVISRKMAYPNALECVKVLIDYGAHSIEEFDYGALTAKQIEEGERIRELCTIRRECFDRCAQTMLCLRSAGVRIGIVSTVGKHLWSMRFTGPSGPSGATAVGGPLPLP